MCGLLELRDGRAVGQRVSQRLRDSARVDGAETLDILKAESEPGAGDVGVRIRTGLVSAAWAGFRSYAGFDECAGHVTEFDVEVLRCPPE